MVFQPIGCFLLSFWSTDLWSTDFSHLLGAMKHFQNKSISLTIHPNMCLLYMHSWNLEDGQDMAHSGSLRGVGLVGDRLSAFTSCFLILGYKSNFYFKIKIYIYTNKHTRQPDARTSICITWNHSWSGRGPRRAPHLTPPSGLRDHLESHSSIPDPHSSGE